MKYILIASAFATFGFTSKSFAATTFTWGIDKGLTHQISVAKEFSEKITKLTNNRIKIKIKTYDFKDAGRYIEGIQKGELDINQSLMLHLYPREPRLKIWEYPFLFDSPEHVEKYLESDKAASLLKGVENKYELPIDFTYAGGFVYFKTQKTLNSFSDLAKSTCTFNDSYVFYKEFMAPLGVKRGTDLGGICTEELSSAIEVNRVTHENKFNLTWHRVITRVLRVSKKKLAKVKLKDQKLLISELKKITKKERESVYREKDLMVAIIKNRGLSVNEWSIAKRRAEFNKIKHLGKSLMPTIQKDVDYIRSIAPRRRLKKLAKNL